MRLYQAQHNPLLVKQHFNPRTREGCDAGPVSSCCRCFRHFNPRTREGCDALLVAMAIDYVTDFNPRTREGCDFGKGFIARLDRYISIHAPVKGATCHDTDTSILSVEFQSTHP